MRELIVERLRKAPPLEELLTADDLEKQNEASRQVLKPAAVLLLVVNHAQVPTVLLTQRTTHLSAHAGQIAFPGGSCDAEDCTPERTALREAEEEVGIPADRIEVLGRLPEYRTVTGFAVTPVVGWAEPPLTYRADPHEVADVFEVPLDFLLDAANHQRHFRMLGERRRDYWAIPYGERYIWGATAGMLVTFQRLVKPVSGARWGA